MRTRGIFVVAVLATVLSVGLWVLRHGLPSSSPSSPPQSVSSTASVPSAAPPATLASPALRWDVGGQRSYALHSEQTLHFIAQPAPTDRVDPAGPAQDRYQIRIDGTWQVAVLRLDAFSVLLEVRLGDPRVVLGSGADAAAGATADEQEQAQRLQGLLSTPFFIQQSLTGQLRAVRLPRGRGHTPLSRGIVKALVASLQYVRSSDGGTAGAAALTWTTQELDATGEYEARYALRPDRRACEKGRVRYTQVAAAQGLLPVASLGQVRGALHVQFDLDPEADEGGRVRGLSGSDSLDVDPGPGMPRVSSRSTYSLRWLQTTQIADAAARAQRAMGEDLEVLAMGQADIDPDSERRSDQQTVNGAGYGDLLTQLNALARVDDGARRAELLSRFAALVRLDPTAAQKARQTILLGAEPPTTRTLLGALGAAGSGAAQSTLVALAEADALSSDVRSNAVAMLGLGDHPTDATAVALSKLARDRDPDVRGTAALALGNASLAQRKEGHVGEAEQAVDELLAKLQAATTQEEQLLYIQALGNAGDARALPALQTALSAGDVELRSAAVTALRFIADDRVDALIAATVLRDPAERVRRSAVFAASFRSLLIFLGPLRQAAQSDADAGVRLDIVGVLGRSLATPGVLDVLSALAANDPAPDVRRAAAALLTPRAPAR